MARRMSDEEAHEFYADPANQEPAGEPRALPRRPLSTHVPVRFRPETIALIKELAAREDTTVSGWIRKEIDEAIRRKLPRPRTRRVVLPVRPGVWQVASLMAVPNFGGAISGPPADSGDEDTSNSNLEGSVA